MTFVTVFKSVRQHFKMESMMNSFEEIEIINLKSFQGYGKILHKNNNTIMDKILKI